MSETKGRSPKVPGYDRLTRIGSGGFSTVYRAYEAKFDRVVAIKVLSLAVSDPVAQRRFIRECQLMGRLGSHPHVLTVFASDVLDDDRPYIVMEYLEGGTSSEVAPLPEADVLRTGVLVGSALASIHVAGVVHRDVKPHNVLLSAYGQPVLADFGVSGVIQQDGSVSNPMALSPLYAAPEAFGGLPTAASDQYSLGATLYALLADRSPAEGSTDEPLTQIMVRALETPPEPLPPDVAGPATWAVLERALAKSPEDRFASVADMVGALQDAQEALGLAVTAGVGGSVEARTPPPPGAGARVPTHRPLGGAAPPAKPVADPPAGTGDTRPAAWPEPVALAADPGPLLDADATRSLTGGGAPPPPDGVGGLPVHDGPGDLATTGSGEADEAAEESRSRRPDDGERRLRGSLLPVLVLIVVGIVLALVVTVVLQTGSDDPTVNATTTEGPPSGTALYPRDVTLTRIGDTDEATLEWLPVPGVAGYAIVPFTEADPGRPGPLIFSAGTRFAVDLEPDVETCFLVRGLTAAEAASDPVVDVNTVTRNFSDTSCTEQTEPAIVSPGS